MARLSRKVGIAFAMALAAFGLVALPLDLSESSAGTRSQGESSEQAEPPSAPPRDADTPEEGHRDRSATVPSPERTDTLREVARSASFLRTARTHHAIATELEVETMACRVPRGEAISSNPHSRLRLDGGPPNLVSPARIVDGWLIATLGQEQNAAEVEVGGLGVLRATRGERSEEGWWECAEGTVELHRERWIHGTLAWPGAEVYTITSCFGAARAGPDGAFSVHAVEGPCPLTVEIRTPDGAWCWDAGVVEVGDTDVVTPHLRPDPDEPAPLCGDDLMGTFFQGWWSTHEMILAAETAE